MTASKDARRPRIGIDCREAFREAPRGIGLYCRHLIREMAALEPAVELQLYHERPRPAGFPDVPPWMRLNRLEMKGSRFHLWERVALPLRLLSDGIELYHGTYNTLPPRVPFSRRPRFVVTLHDVIVTWWDDDHDDPFVRYARKVTKRVIRQADAIVTVSDFSRRDIVERFGVDAAKIRVIHNGLHPLFLEDVPARTGEAARERFAGGRPYLYAIGAKLRRKNTDALFPMLRRLIDAGKLGDELLIITGLQGEALDERRAAAERAGVSDRVRLLGYQTHDDLRALFAGARLFVYPSLVEGWGIPVLESLACGTPVCTSAAAAMPEAGGEHATYFDPSDTDSIVGAVGRALDGEHDFALVREAAIRRARAFTWRRHVAELLALYEHVLGRSRASRRV